MRCILCGWVKKGKLQFFICDDCQKFSQIINKVWDDVNKKFENISTIDPTADPVFRLLSDSVFITSHNPQVTIFYNTSKILVDGAFNSKNEITEEELNKKLRTTRPITYTLKLFEDLGLIKVELGRYQRKIILQDKIKKVVDSIKADKLDKQVTRRISQILGGYIMLYILYKTAGIKEIDEIYELPYKQRYRTLWVVLMFLWTNAHDNNKKFSEKELTKFIGRRGVSSASIIPALTSIDPRKSTGILKDVRIDGETRNFYFADYILREMERIREIERERTEAG